MKSRSKLYFTSDWHLGHENVIEYSNRPFSNIFEMREALVKRYNAVVSENDTCYFLGDMGFNSGDEILNTITRLNGKKILVLGNHDKGRTSMEEKGFDLVLNTAAVAIQNQLVTLSHMPLRGIPRENLEGMRGVIEGESWHGEFREKSKFFSIPSWGQFHLHGHIHSPNNGKSVSVLDRQMDVGVDSNNYTPVSQSQIEGWIMRTLSKERVK